MCWMCCVFFFKQKTADEMRISDWSSDVCSSDLTPPMALAGADKTAMPEDDSSTLHAPEIPDKRRSWLDRISSMLSGEPSTRDDLVALLRAVQAHGLLAAVTLKMMEGALTVSDISVGAVMVPLPQLMMLAAVEHLLNPPTPTLTTG